jgi:hypothetical protein
VKEIVMKFLVSVLSMGALCLAGCSATGSPQWDSTFGDAARQTTASQVIDPGAPARKRALVGIDGKAAAGATKAYAESYGYAVKEAKQSNLTIVPVTTGR